MIFFDYASTYTHVEKKLYSFSYFNNYFNNKNNECRSFAKSSYSLPWRPYAHLTSMLYKYSLCIDVDVCSVFPIVTHHSAAFSGPFVQ